MGERNGSRGNPEIRRWAPWPGLAILIGVVFAIAASRGQAIAQPTDVGSDRARRDGTVGVVRVADLDATTEYYRGYRDALRDIARSSGWRAPYRTGRASGASRYGPNQRDGQTSTGAGTGAEVERRPDWIPRVTARARGGPTAGPEATGETGAQQPREPLADHARQAEAPLAQPPSANADPQQSGPRQSGDPRSSGGMGHATVFGSNPTGLPR